MSNSHRRKGWRQLLSSTRIHTHTHLSVPVAGALTACTTQKRHHRVLEEDGEEEEEEEAVSASAKGERESHWGNKKSIQFVWK